MLSHFDPEKFGALVLDESSILKGFDGRFRREVTEFASRIPFRLACTATPAPNDLVEIVNHAEFLGIMAEKEIKALFFSNKATESTQKWVLKEHAREDFWTWLASWAVCLRKPSDLGFDDDGFILPPLEIQQVVVGNGGWSPRSGGGRHGFGVVEAQGLRERQLARQASVDGRVQAAADLVNGDREQWLVWCDLNVESAALAKIMEGAVEVCGADSREHKERSLIGFQDGAVRALVTKPSIAGFGMNLQNCDRMVFVGLSDSYEKFYQAVRRSWRFGQDRPVTAYVVTSQAEGGVVRNIERKEAEALALFDNLISNMNLGGQLSISREEESYVESVERGEGWELQFGDSVETMGSLADESVGLSVFSPPFPGMYVYTNTRRDVGNSQNLDELVAHFRFIMDKDHLLRVTMPGRHCCIHLSQAVAFKGSDGYIGVKDFRGRVIQMMEEEGWIYYGEVCIDKDPQLKAIRTKDRGLLFKTLANDAAHLHPALADYLLQFRKPGDNPEPIRAGISEKYGNPGGWVTQEEWIEWAAPVWYKASQGLPGGIRESDVLSVVGSKDDKDEKHLAPLQLGVIERAVKLWTNPGDLVCSPFAGIGSEGYVARCLGRRFWGCELKRAYFDVAVKNVKMAKARTGGFNLGMTVSRNRRR